MQYVRDSISGLEKASVRAPPTLRRCLSAEASFAPNFTGADAGPRNRLLAALPQAELKHLQPHFKVMDLETHQVLIRPEETASRIFFPEYGCISQVSYLENGDVGEISLVGPEGVVGFAPALGHDSDSYEAVVQTPGLALWMEVKDLQEMLGCCATLQRLIHRYVLAHFEQVARTAICNGRHTVIQRIARRLLMMHDRVPGDTFPMTQEHLAMLLGVRRASVTVAAIALQTAGAIQYVRGRITIANRHGLEDSSCECYKAIRHSYGKILGGFDPPS